MRSTCFVTFKMTELLDVFLARLELEAKRNSSEVLDAMEIDDAQPISNVYVHRLGQLDRRVCFDLTVLLISIHHQIINSRIFSLHEDFLS